MFSTIIENLILYPKGGSLFLVSIFYLYWILYTTFFFKKKQWSSRGSKKIYRTYLAFVIITTVWVLSNAYFEFFDFVTYAGEVFAYWMYVLSGLSFSFGIAVFYYFTTIIGQPNKKISKFDKYFIIFILFQSLIFTLIPRLSILNIYIDQGIAIAEYNRIGEVAFYVFSLMGIFVGFYNLMLTNNNFKKKENIEKRQFSYIAVGVFGMYFSAILFHMIWPIFLQNYDYAWLPPFFSLLNILIIGYGIMIDRFFDLHFAIIQLLKKAIAFFIAFLIIYSLGVYLKNIASIGEYNPYFYSSMTLLCLLIYFWILHFFERHFLNLCLGPNNASFFRAKVKSLTQSQKVYGTLESFKKDLKKIFCEAMKIQDCEIIIINHDNKKRYRPIIKQTEITKRIIVLAELIFKFHKTNKKNPIIPITQITGEILLPLFNAADEMIGIFTLGKKKSNALYSKEEIEIIESMQVYLSLEINNLIYQEKLQKEVNRKTASLNEKKNELEDSYSQLKEVDESKDLFLAMASHELRTPLTIIKGNADFLCSSRIQNSPKIQKQLAQKILTSTDRLLSIVNDILDLSKIEAGEMKLYKEKVPLRPLIESALDRYRIPMSEKGLTLHFEYKKDTPSALITDKVKLIQIIDNLINNAIKFTEKGSITLTIWSEAKKMFFSVKDTGMGISPEDQKKLFKKFSQAENFMQKNIVGTGLGLVIVKKILELMDGEIWIENGNTKGSEFRFCIPQTESKKS